MTGEIAVVAGEGVDEAQLDELDDRSEGVEPVPGDGLTQAVGQHPDVDGRPLTEEELQGGLEDTDRRINRSGAMNAAMVQMGMNAAGSRSPRGRVAVGVGFQEGEKALAVGYAKAIGERASISFGASFSGDEKSAGVGFGIDL